MVSTIDYIFTEKFKTTLSCQTVKILSLKVDKPYPVEQAEKIPNRYGEAFLLTLRETPQSCVKVFVTKRYGALFTVADLLSIK
jgi:hypothetical protein